jgi:hypothetical protein
MSEAAEWAKMELCEALADGKTIQYRDRDGGDGMGWHDWTPDRGLPNFADYQMWQVKPRGEPSQESKLLDDIVAIAMDPGYARGDRLQRIVSRIHAVQNGSDYSQHALRSDGVRDAERFEWLTADLPEGDEAHGRRELLSRIPVMGYGAICEEIDRRRKEGEAARFAQAARDAVGVADAAKTADTAQPQGNGGEHG